MRRFATIAIYTLLSLTAAVSLSACASKFSAPPPTQQSVRIKVSEADVVNTRATVRDDTGTLVVDFLPDGKVVAKRTQYNKPAYRSYAGISKRAVWEIEQSTNTVWIHGGPKGWFDRKGNRWQMFGPSDSWNASRYVTPTHLPDMHYPVTISRLSQ